MSPPELDHEDVVIHRGHRSGLPILVALHSTARGPALGGCRVVEYPTWTDGLDDVMRLARGMTDKAAAAGLRFGGGKTVVPLAPGSEPSPARRREVMLDVGDVVGGLDGRYVVGPDAGTGPHDMAVIAERTSSVVCTPHGCGDPAPYTARAALRCVQEVSRHLDGAELAGRRVTVVGLGHVGAPLARGLAACGARLTLSDLDPRHRALAHELAADWVPPAEAWTTPTDLLVPAALGSHITAATAGELRCAAIVGPANDQLLDDAAADALHARGVLWAPDPLVGAGGIVYATAAEIDRVSDDEIDARLDGVAETLRRVLTDARREGVNPWLTARRLVRDRLRAATEPTG